MGTINLLDFGTGDAAFKGAGDYVRAQQALNGLKRWRIVLPDAEVITSRPVNLPMCELVGSGPESKVTTFHRGHGLCFGVKPKTIDRPDLTPYGTGYAGKRGVVVSRQKWVQVEGHDATMGTIQSEPDGGWDWFSNTDKLTIAVEVAPYGGAAALPQQMTICGEVHEEGAGFVAEPYCLMVEEATNAFWVWLTDDASDDRYRPSVSRYGFALPAGTTFPCRIITTANLATGQAFAWVGSGATYNAPVRVPVSIMNGMTGGRKLREAMSHPWTLGCDYNRAGRGSTDQVLVSGLHVQRSSPYVTTGSVGDAISRNDLGAVNATSLFFTPAPTTSVYMRLDDDPAEQDWTVAVADKNGTNARFPVCTTDVGGVGPGVCRDFDMVSNGPCIAIGGVLGYEFLNLRLNSWTDAVRSVQAVTSYKLRFQRCTMQCGDAALDLYKPVVDVEDCNLDAGREVFRYVAGGGVMKNIMIGSGRAYTRRAGTILQTDGAGVNMVLENWLDDSEAWGYSKGYFLIHDVNTVGTTFSAKNVVSANVTGKVMFDLRGIPAVQAGSQPNTPQFFGEALSAGFRSGAPLVTCDGPRWSGSVHVKDPAADFAYTGAAGTSNLYVNGTRYGSTPPGGGGTTALIFAVTG